MARYNKRNILYADEHSSSAYHFIPFRTDYTQIRRNALKNWGTAYNSIPLRTDYTQIRKSALQNPIFAYKVEGVSVPEVSEMEKSYRFIRVSKIRELSISFLRTNQFFLNLFIRNLAKGLCEISGSRIN